jgi:hypothetical protein
LDVPIAISPSRVSVKKQPLSMPSVLPTQEKLLLFAKALEVAMATITAVVSNFFILCLIL